VVDHWEEKTSALFNILEGKSVRKYQEKSWKLFFEDVLEKKSILLIRLPCGYGKTAIGIMPYLVQVKSDEWPIAPRLIYVLPMRYLANQVAEKISEWLQSLAKMSDLDKQIKVKVHHGENLEDPYFFADIVVTTLDSFLIAYTRRNVYPYSSKRKHPDFSSGSIGLSMVVFDEAHLYHSESGFTFALIRELLQCLSKAGVPTIVMTATMPDRFKQAIFADIQLKEVSYKYDERFEEEYKKSYELMLSNDMISCDNLRRIEEAKSTLVVCNTVFKAQHIYKELNERYDNVRLLHSRFTSFDRKQIWNEIKKKLVKKDLILVTTQVCEAGFDFSFDLLITECSPADSLVQRVGRVARWGGYGLLNIIKPESEAPYIKGSVSRTWEWLVVNKKHLDFSLFTSREGKIGTTNFIDQTVGDIYAQVLLKETSEKLRALIDFGRNSLFSSTYNEPIKVRDDDPVTLIKLREDQYNDIGFPRLDCIISPKDFMEMTFSVDFKWLCKHKDKLIIFQHDKGACSYTMTWDNKVNGFRVSKAEGDIMPWFRYILLKDAYEKELGCKPYVNTA